MDDRTEDKILEYPAIHAKSQNIWLKSKLIRYTMESKVLVIKTLIVDDYTPLRKAAVEVLKSEGFKNVIEAESPDEGMKMFKEHKPDLVIMDIIMPSGRGIDLVREIKNIDQTKIVMLTVLSGEKPKKESLEAGADLYIVKPLTSENVSEIKKLMGL